MICTISKVFSSSFTLKVSDKIKAYQFDNEKAAIKNRAKLAKFLKSKDFKIHYDH